MSENPTKCSCNRSVICSFKICAIPSIFKAYIYKKYKVNNYFVDISKLLVKIFGILLKSCISSQNFEKLDHFVLSPTLVNDSLFTPPNLNEALPSMLINTKVPFRGGRVG